MAANLAAGYDDTNYFIRLVELGFPLYDIDQKNDIPAFLITEVKNDNKFISSFHALLQAGFDINHQVEGEEDSYTFLEKLLLKG